MSAQVVRRLPFHQPSSHLLGARNHGCRSRTDQGRHEPLPCDVERRRLFSLRLRASLRARSTRRATDAGLANDSRPNGSAHALLGSPETIHWTPSASERRYSRRNTSLDRQRNPVFPRHLAIGRQMGRHVMAHVQGPKNPLGKVIRKEQCVQCASTGMSSSCLRPTKNGDQRISPMACLLGGGRVHRLDRFARTAVKGRLHSIANGWRQLVGPLAYGRRADADCVGRSRHRSAKQGNRFGLQHGGKLSALTAICKVHLALSGF